MKNYGITIKEIRKKQGLTQKEVYSGTVSRSFYVLFEKGESDISVSKFKKILDNLALSFEEFLYIHENTESEINTISNRIFFFWKEKMYNELLDIYEKYKNSPITREHYLALYAYSLVFSLKGEAWYMYPDPLEELHEYFSRKKVLTLREIDECIYLFQSLNIPDILSLLDKALTSLQKYKKLDLTKYSENYALLGLIKIQALLSLEKLDEAKFFLEDLEFEIDSSHSVKGFLNYKTAEIILGLRSSVDKWEEEIERFTNVMKYLDPESWTQNIEIILEHKVMAQKKSSYF